MKASISGIRRDLTGALGLALTLALFGGQAGSARSDSDLRFGAFPLRAQEQLIPHTTTCSATGAPRAQAPSLGSQVDLESFAAQLSTAPPALPAHQQTRTEIDLDDDAHEDYGPDEGDWEFTLSGVGFNDEDFDVGAFTLGASLGYYLTEVVEVAVRQNVSFADTGDSDWNGSTRLALDLHFPMGAFRPFIGANVGWVYGDTLDETAAAAPEAGVKIFLKEDAFLFGMAEYQFFFDDTDQIDDGFENGSFVYSVGIGLTF